MTSLTHHNIILQLMSQESRSSIGSLPALVTECHRYRAEIRECVTQLWHRGLAIPDPQVPEVSYFLADGERAVKAAYYHFRLDRRWYWVGEIMGEQGERQDEEWVHPSWPHRGEN